MSTLTIVLIAAGAMVLVVFLGGLAAARRRDRLQGADYSRHVADADAALEAARAADKGWDRATMEQAAREAVARDRPDFAVEELHLVLVDDRPGVEHDRAHFVATGGGGKARVVLNRADDGSWSAESVA